MLFSALNNVANIGTTGGNSANNNGTLAVAPGVGLPLTNAGINYTSSGTNTATITGNTANRNVNGSAGILGTISPG